MRRRKATVLFVTTALLCAAMGALQAQVATTNPAKMAADADPDWEVVTVRPSDPNDKNKRFNVDGRHIVIENQTVETMLLFAYGKQKSQILGAPEWIVAERFDVDGLPDTEGEPSVKQFQAMVRKLLAERFGLQMHTEQKEMPVFALTVVKPGPKLAKSGSDPNGLPDESGGGNRGRQANSFTNYSISNLALELQFYVDRPVVDRTGLTGRYDFKLQWSLDASSAMQPDAPPELFTALQEQLGLKLEPTRLQVDVLVIDKVERPGAN